MKIHKFQKLTYLGIASTGVKEIPHLNLPELTSLDLFANDLSSAPPETFTGLPLIRTLSMNSCSFTAVPDLSAFADTLLELQLNSNAFEEIKRHDLCKMPKLLTLRFHNVNLNNFPCPCSLLNSATISANEFTQLPRIISCAKDVHFHDNDITHIRSTQAATLKKLNRLYMHRNPLERLEDFLDLENNPSATLDLRFTDTLDLCKCEHV